MARQRSDQPPTVRFYQLGGLGREQALAKIAHKAYGQGLRLCVVAGEPQRARFLDDFLWKFPPELFLPHGLCGSGEEALQPVLVCGAAVDDNGATVALLDGGGMLEEPERFDLVVEFVDGNDPAGLRESRQRYRRYRESGCRMEYWVQGERGWEQR